MFDDEGRDDDGPVEEDEAGELERLLQAVVHAPPDIRHPPLPGSDRSKFRLYALSSLDACEHPTEVEHFKIEINSLVTPGVYAGADEALHALNIAAETVRKTAAGHHAAIAGGLRPSTFAPLTLRVVQLRDALTDHGHVSKAIKAACRDLRPGQLDRLVAVMHVDNNHFLVIDVDFRSLRCRVLDSNAAASFRHYKEQFLVNTVTRARRVLVSAAGMIHRGLTEKDFIISPGTPIGQQIDTPCASLAAFNAARILLGHYDDSLPESLTKIGLPSILLTEEQKQAESVVAAACGCPLDWTGLAHLLEDMPFLKEEYQRAIQELVRLAALYRSAPRPNEKQILLPPDSRDLVTRAFGTVKPAPLPVPPVPAPRPASPPISCDDSDDVTAAVAAASVASVASPGTVLDPAGAAQSVPVEPSIAAPAASTQSAEAAAVAASTAATPDPSSPPVASALAARLLTVEASVAESAAPRPAPRPAAHMLLAALPVAPPSAALPTAAPTAIEALSPTVDSSRSAAPWNSFGTHRPTSPLVNLSSSSSHLPTASDPQPRRASSAHDIFIASSAYDHPTCAGAVSLSDGAPTSPLLLLSSTTCRGGVSGTTLAAGEGNGDGGRRPDAISRSGAGGAAGLAGAASAGAGGSSLWKRRRPDLQHEGSGGEDLQPGGPNSKRPCLRAGADDAARIVAGEPGDQLEFVEAGVDSNEAAAAGAGDDSDEEADAADAEADDAASDVAREGEAGPSARSLPAKGDSRRPSPSPSSPDLPSSPKVAGSVDDIDDDDEDEFCRHKKKQAQRKPQGGKWALPPLSKQNKAALVRLCEERKLDTAGYNGDLKSRLLEWQLAKRD